MPDIVYKKGDLFTQLPTDPRIHIFIPHCCNDIGKMGSGFVVPLCRRWPEVKEQYQAWSRQTEISEKYPTKFELGQNQWITVEKNITVINMIAQHGIVGPNNPHPIKYSALAQCMDDICKEIWIMRTRATWHQETEIHCPQFGSNLAGGNWDFISILIKECWCEKNIPVTVYIYRPGDGKKGSLNMNEATETTVYKVCHIDKKGVWESCCQNSYFPANLIAKYTIGKITTPPMKGSYLFAFKTAKDALHFMHEENWFAYFSLLECKATGVHIPAIKFMPSPRLTAEFWMSWVTKENLSQFNSSISDLPGGTVWCESITPVRQIEFSTVWELYKATLDC